MKQFLITSRLPEVFSEEFLSLIPEQRSTVNKLMGQGIILSYSLAADRSRTWIVMEAASEVDVIRYLSEFPLIKFMRPDIQELMFHHSLSFMLPNPSLN